MPRKSKAVGFLIVLAMACLGFAGLRAWQAEREAQASAVPPAASARSNQASVDFSALAKDYPTAVAWLRIPGTPIDFPVVQGSDNSFYISHAATGDSSRYGSIFLDHRSHADFSDYYSVIFGHNMKDDKMFGSLVQFQQQAFFERVTTGWLYTPAGRYELQIFACAVTDSRSEYYRLDYFAPAEKEALRAMLASKAKQYRALPLGDDDRIVCLSTCSYEYSNARTVVLAKLVDFA